jgi:hypothetical protein
LARVDLAYLLPPRLPLAAAFFGVLLGGMERLFLSRSCIRSSTRPKCDRLISIP